MSLAIDLEVAPSEGPAASGSEVVQGDAVVQVFVQGLPPGLVTKISIFCFLPHKGGLMSVQGALSLSKHLSLE